MSVAFVFPGGASLGAAQVGMARALHDAGIRPDVLIGSSAGALNAAFLATRPAAFDELERVWTAIRRRDVARVSPRRVALGLLGRRDHLVSPAPLRRVVERVAAGARIEHTAVPLHVVATDVVRGIPMLLSEGDLADALLASSAMPGLFPPVRVGDRMLVDGGVTADTPVREAVALGAQEIFVLPTYAGVDEVPANAIGMLFHTLGLLVGRVGDLEVATARERAHVHVLPAPAGPAPAPFDFRHTHALIASAYRDTTAWLDVSVTRAGIS